MNVKERFKEILKKGIDLTKRISTKNLIIIGCVTLVLSAGVLNFVMFSDAEDKDVNYGSSNMDDNASANASGNNTDYFSSTALNRQKARDEALEVLQSVVDNSDSVEATKEQALSEISKIADEIQLEANIETLILSKGFEQCVAVINGDLVNIIVKSDGLLANEVAQINEIVFEQTGVMPANVKIIEKNY